jgi:hypothetical protein
VEKESKEIRKTATTEEKDATYESGSKKIPASAPDRKD